MESFKSLSDYPSVPSKIFTAENLAKYNDYIQEAVEQSRKMELAARECASKNFIQFHTR
jgi:hypothetical protein